MNGYLVDTHIVIWALDDDVRLKRHHRAVIASEMPLWVSMATLWEIAIKRSLGKLKSPDNLPEKLHRAGYRILDITTRHIDALEVLPRHHGDPFDRMLIVQAQVEKLAILTVDRHFSSYEIELA